MGTTSTVCRHTAKWSGETARTTFVECRIASSGVFAASTFYGVGYRLALGWYSNVTFLGLTAGRSTARSTVCGKPFLVRRHA